MPNGVKEIAWLAMRDFAHEWRMSICFVAALAAVLAPLLVLFGLKFGLIDAMSRRLAEDPRNLEIVLVGSGRFPLDWYDDMAARPEVAFVIARTRQIAAGAKLTAPDVDRARVVDVELIPSGPGDPLLGSAAPPNAASVVLSERAARDLNVAAGGRVLAIITRTMQSGRQTARLELAVSSVLDAAAFARPAAFVTPEALTQAEDFRDGRAAPLWGHADDPPPPTPEQRRYASFRLYAADFDAVGRLRDLLLDAGLEVRTRAAEIDTVRRLDAGLSAIFWIVAGMGGTGYLASLGASLWANVERKRRALSVLRLVGFPTGALAVFPLAQALCIAAFGALTAIALALLAAAIINSVFAGDLGEGDAVARILPGHALGAALVTCVFALVAALASGVKAARVEPSEGLRDE